MYIPLQIRIAAMKTLPTLFKECKNKETGTTVAGILAQLLQLDEPQEYNVASNSLFHILKEDPLNTIKSIFKQIQESDNLLRDKCIKFLIAKVKILEKSVYTTEIEDYVINETKQLLQDASSDEYISLMPFLMSTRLGNSLSGQQELIEMTAQQIEIDRDLPPENLDKNLDRLVTCVKFILPYFSPKIDSAKFVKYICDRILPHWEYLSSLSNGSVLQLALLRELAELSLHCGKLENPSLYVVQIFDKLKYYMPLPPEDTEIKNIPNFEFTAIEALLYSFHKLARQCPDFLTHDPSVLKDFRTRLMYLSRGVQGCQKALNSSDNLKDKVLSPDEMKKLKITPKLLSNINTLIKDLFYQPPMYKATVSLSYRLNDENLAAKVVTEKATITAPKRHVPITFESNGSTPNKQNRSNRPGENQKLYAPPSGKFSNNLNYGELSI